MQQRLSLMKQPMFSVLNDHAVDYPSPININYLWGFGSLAAIFLGVQILTGIFITCNQNERKFRTPKCMMPKQGDGNC